MLTALKSRSPTVWEFWVFLINPWTGSLRFYFSKETSGTLWEALPWVGLVLLLFPVFWLLAGGLLDSSTSLVE